MSSRSLSQVKRRDMPSFLFLFHSGTCALFSAVLSFHVATASDRSEELKSEEHFEGKTFLPLPEWICRGLGSTAPALSYRKPLFYWPPESSVYITKGFSSIQFLVWKISITRQNPSEVYAWFVLPGNQGLIYRHIFLCPKIRALLVERKRDISYERSKQIS